MSDFYVKLMSDACLNFYPQNSQASFTNNLPYPLILEDYEMALTGAIIPYSYDLIGEENCSFAYKVTSELPQADEIPRDEEATRIKRYQETITGEIREIIDREETTKVHHSFLKEKVDQLDSTVQSRISLYTSQLSNIEKELLEAVTTVKILDFDFLKPERVYALPGSYFDKMQTTIALGDHTKSKLETCETQI